MDLSLDTLIRNVRKNPNCRDTNVDAVVKLFDDIHALQNISLAEQVRGIAERIGYRTYLSEFEAYVRDQAVLFRSRPSSGVP
ncbi:hypothetical protein DXA13_19450 [Clostridium sp. AM58-1XD]|nr:hypothetical protein DXA13_19450 [Clostridium sp. AM58-1XD]